MDTLSHALIGMAVAGLSGHQPAFSDPIYIAAVLGAEAPDFDIVAQAWGRIAYLKQHRAFSHSLPGLGLWSGLIAAGIGLFIPGTPLLPIFLWALAGGLSHILIDYFNTHGVAICWPLRKERKSFPLLNVFDPLLLALLIGQYLIPQPMWQIAWLSFALLGLYFFARLLLRLRAVRFLRRQFTSGRVQRIWVMPCLNHLFAWDFVVETAERHINGRLYFLSSRLEIKANFPKQGSSELALQARQTSLGEFFDTFSPFVYIEEAPGNEAKITFYDLRYFSGQQFIHSATILFGDDNLPTEAYIHSLGKTVKVN